MKTRTAALSALLATLFITSAFAQNKEVWRKVDNHFFSFSVPQSFKKKEVHPIDEFVEMYVAHGIEMAFDFGAYANNFQDWPKETEFERLKVDGKFARIATATNLFHYSSFFHKRVPYSIQIHIELADEDSLSMWAHCNSQKDIAVARKIFASIVFKQVQKP